MAYGFLNDCRWRATSAGTVDFVAATAFGTGYLPSECLNPAIVNGNTYHYFAIYDNEHEEGDGVWTVASNTLTRATIRNSSNSGAKVNFSGVPVVIMGGPVSADMNTARASYNLNNFWLSGDSDNEGIWIDTAGNVYTSGNLRPYVNNGAALGSLTNQWADLYLANGGIIAWNNNEISLQHPSTNSLAVKASAINASMSLQIVNTATDGGSQHADAIAIIKADNFSNAYWAGITGAKHIDGVGDTLLLRAMTSGKNAIVLWPSGGVQLGSISSFVDPTSGRVSVTDRLSVGTTSFPANFNVYGSSVGGAIEAEISNGADGYAGIRLKANNLHYLFSKRAAAESNKLQLYYHNGSSYDLLQCWDTNGNCALGFGTPQDFGGTNFETYHATSWASVIAHSGSKMAQVLAHSSSGIRVGARSNDVCVFTSNDVEGMRIDTNQRVMIGTTAPIGTARLTISETSSGTGLSIDTATGVYIFKGMRSSSPIFELYKSTSGPTVFTSPNNASTGLGYAFYNANTMQWYENANAAGMVQTMAQQVVNTTSGGSVSTSGLVPAGGTILGVTIRVLQTITGAPSIRIGNGADVDHWGNAIGLAAGTTTTSADFTADPTYFSSTAHEVTIDANGGTFATGQVRVTVVYRTFTAATS